MGLPMTINLVKADHEVIGFDLQQSTREALVKAGGQATGDLTEAVADVGEVEFVIVRENQDWVR